jgi:transcriptional regulator with XRE-family HTH domain
LSRKKLGRKEPKVAHACPLNDLLWERIDEVLRNRHETVSDLWRKVKRDKNTYTNWIRRRTIPKVSDLQEFAEALNVKAAELLCVPDAAGDATGAPEQLDLPFRIGPKSVQFEVQYTTSGLVLKRLGKTA